MRRLWRTLIPAILLAVLISACGTGATGPAGDSNVPDTTGSEPPTAVASGPSDVITGVWVLGTVTRGGSGPCYGLTTDDGRQLALSGKTLGPLTNGDRIRVLVQASERPIDCGPGEQFSATEVKRAG